MKMNVVLHIYCVKLTQQVQCISSMSRLSALIVGKLDGKLYLFSVVIHLVSYRRDLLKTCLTYYISFTSKITKGFQYAVLLNRI